MSVWFFCLKGYYKNKTNSFVSKVIRFFHLREKLANNKTEEQPVQANSVNIVVCSKATRPYLTLYDFLWRTVHSTHIYILIHIAVYEFVPVRASADILNVFSTRIFSRGYKCVHYQTLISKRTRSILKKHILYAFYTKRTHSICIRNAFTTTLISNVLSTRMRSWRKETHILY